ncbi:hypothetical protein ACRRTK_014203 [Alexandromys fortis]
MACNHQSEVPCFPGHWPAAGARLSLIPLRQKIGEGIHFTSWLQNSFSEMQPALFRKMP